MSAPDRVAAPRADGSPADRAAVEHVRTEIPGTVLRVEVAVGDAVDRGDAVALLESMKMEIPVLAGRAGTIDEVLVRTGDAVPTDHVIATVVERAAP